MKSLLLVASLVALAVAGCSSAPTGPAEPPKDAQGHYVIHMPASGTTFSPKAAKVPLNATVVWTNDGSTGHDVNTDDGMLSSDKALGHKMAKGETYSYTFTKPGTYQYHCIIHQSTGMVGSIVVQ